MKKLLLLSFIISLNFFAQEPGKVGQKLPNEMQAEKVTNKKNTDVKKKNYEKPYNNPRYGNNNNQGNPNQNQYYWNDNYSNGYAEVFLRIPEYGLFSVTLDDQNMATPTGKFRFFDAVPGQNLLQIYQNGRLVFQTRLRIENGKRLILDYFSRDGLYLLETVSLRNYGMNQQNYSDLWNHFWNDNYGDSPYDYGNNWNPYFGMNDDQNSYYNDAHPNQNNNDYYDQNPNTQHGHNDYENNNHQGSYGYNHPRPMSQQDFAQFKTVVKQQSFEDTKLQMIKTQPHGTWYTSEQIKDLMGLFSFDDNRLDVAIFAYDRCVDPQNFYTTYSALTYDSSKNDLMEYVAGRERK
jgi:hypothetical protein